MQTHCPHDPPYTASAEVQELQSALRANHFYGGKSDGMYGDGTADAVHRAKWRLGYPRRDCDHCGGEKLFNFLTGKKKLPVAYRLRRRARGFGLSRADRQRNAVVKWAKWGVTNEPDIHYKQIRPIPHQAHLPMTTDCSGFVTLCYELAGAKDPNGNGYNGQGWTGTLLSHGVTVPVMQSQPGDLVIWGVMPGHHVAVITGTDRSDPVIVSHGQERGPVMLRLSEETKAQGGRPYVIKRYIF